MFICVLTCAGALHAPQSSHVREGGVGAAPRGNFPELVGILSPSLVGALWRVITGEDGACMPALACDYWGERDVHPGVSRCVRGPDQARTHWGVSQRGRPIREAARR